jgi:hypothetical protein
MTIPALICTLLGDSRSVGGVSLRAALTGTICRGSLERLVADAPVDRVDPWVGQVGEDHDLLGSGVDGGPAHGGRRGGA